MCSSELCTKSPPGGRMIVAQRFIAIRQPEEIQSAKGTTAIGTRTPSFMEKSSRPFHGLHIGWAFVPSSKLLGYSHSSALRTFCASCSTETPADKPLASRAVEHHVSRNPYSVSADTSIVLRRHSRFRFIAGVLRCLSR
jgi:hypothetical protein